jgi:hypothetical protein
LFLKMFHCWFTFLFPSPSSQLISFKSFVMSLKFALS